MIVKAIYRRNLKMTEGKVASQVAHAVVGLSLAFKPSKIIVLKVTDKKFGELAEQNDCYLQEDGGFTEVNKGEVTAAAWVENEPAQVRS